MNKEYLKQNKWKILAILLIVLIAGYGIYEFSTKTLDSKYSEGYAQGQNDTVMSVYKTIINELNTKGYLQISDAKGNVVTLVPYQKE